MLIDAQTELMEYQMQTECVSEIVAFMAKNPGKVHAYAAFIRRDGLSELTNAKLEDSSH
jgi:hypothetical protein